MKGDLKITVRYVEPTDHERETRRYHMRKFLEGVMLESEEKQNNADGKQEKVHKVA